MDDLQAQFLITVGDVCASAELIGLEVELGTHDGRRLRGVPGCLDAPEGTETVSDTGYPRVFSLNGGQVALEDVVELVLSVPQHPSPAHLRVAGGASPPPA